MKLSIIIAAYNYPERLFHTLKNLQDSARQYTDEYEVIIVDDGTVPPLESDPRFHAFQHIRWVTQENQGSAVAKTNGVLESTGEYVFLSDSDDLIDSTKLKKQIDGMESSSAEISYSQEKFAWLDEQLSVMRSSSISRHPVKLNALDLLIHEDLRSNNLVYRGDLIRKALEKAPLAPMPLYGPVGDYYILYMVALQKARTVCVDEFLNYWCQYKEGQVSLKRLQLVLSSHRFYYDLLNSSEVQKNQQFVAEFVVRVFRSYRKLPRGTHPKYLRFWEMLLKPYARLLKGEVGGPLFQVVAAALGPLKAARVLRCLQVRTLQSMYHVDQKDFVVLANDYLPEALLS
ncbi:MAG: glycosyltransferase family 2 protein [Candidatus Sumerlaeia bacterium]|nr:glycosyltransferase family 2 protein [Candidatus Sumerlaeia bacterium]